MTKYVIDKMNVEFTHQQVFVDVFLAEDVQAEKTSLTLYDIVGLAYPVHAFNAPKIVVDFARRLPSVDSIDTFILSTAGDSHPLNMASSGLLIKTLHEKGFRVYYDKQFIMPSNFIIKDDEAKVQDKLGKAIAEIPKAVREILNRVALQQKSSLSAKIVAVLGRLEWVGLKCGKFFRADGKCRRCGLCAMKCPNRNISTSESGVVFGRKCGLCMRCVYLCSENAIKARWPFRFIGFDAWYENEELCVAKRFADRQE